jgi:hypothetical protein
LPPAIHIPDRAINEARLFRRDTIALVLGGSLKVTFPYPRNRSDGPMYACVKENEQDFLPKGPGHHGILIVKSLPEALVYIPFMYVCIDISLQTDLQCLPRVRKRATGVIVENTKVTSF